MKTKLYVLEWDAWNFMGVFRYYSEAKSRRRHYLETIKEITVIGEIIDNKVFIATDGQGDWVAIYATEGEAIDRINKIPFEHECFVKQIEIL
jgi:hypothetical protein